MRRMLIAVLAGTVAFGSMWAFATSLTVSSKTLGSGNATVAACNASATITYNTVYSVSPLGYKVTTTPITTAATCNAYAYKVTLSGTGGTSLAEITGALSGTGTASPDFTASNVLAANVTGVSLVITG